jgi:hypothetical protein
MNKPATTYLAIDDGKFRDDLDKHIIEAWSIFQDGYLARRAEKESPDAKFELNPRVLSEAISTALLDMKRMASFHLPGSTPDRHKYAAFFSSWVAKFRPITVTFSGPKYSPDALLVNAGFALYVFQSFLQHPVPVELSRGLVYSFHYRNTQPETLALMAYACERISELTPPPF